MTNNEKKVYTMEDNVRSISFTLKELVKQLAEINFSLQSAPNSSNKQSVDEKEMPF